MRLGYQEFRKWGLYKGEGGSPSDRWVVRILLYTVAVAFLFGIVTGVLFFTIAAVIMFILFLSPRLSRYGSGYLRRMEARYFAEVRADRTPTFPLLSMCVALLMIGSPLFSFWFINALSLFFVGMDMWIYLFIPVMIISAVVFHSLKNRWKEMGGKKWMCNLFLALLYLLFLGISALAWWIL